MKKLYLFAALAAMLAACSENDLTAEKQVVQQNAEEGAVVFDVYTSRTTTRAGWSGSATTEELKKTDNKTLGKSGFGVFGYYTDGEPYSGITKPNFFYNQQVNWKGTAFEYTPVKYWPNEFGEDAISDHVDRLTFFAYLPYVEVNPLTGVVNDDKTNNIIGMTRNNVTGDPYIKYSATMNPSNTVDLCYGVAAEKFTSSNSVLSPNNIEKGAPYISVSKPDLNGKIKFDFKHALAQLNVQIDAVVNQSEPTSTLLDKKTTRIYVRSVTFEGIKQKGALNLNSTAASAEWYENDASGSNKISSGSLTVHDGLKDGKEPNAENKSEDPASLNPVIIQSKPYTIDDDGKITDADDGVTETAVNLFNVEGLTSATPAVKLAAPVYVIPTGEAMKVTIVYDVETVDQNLAFYLSDGKTQGSTIENTITKTIENFGEIKAGLSYTLKLHLGMRTVDFDAAITPWQSISGEADLPSNVPVYAAVTFSSAPVKDVIVPASATKYEFGISGLNPGESVVSSRSSSVTDNYSNLTMNAANASGVAYESVTIAPNMTLKRTNTKACQWEGASSHKGVKLDIKQEPHELGMTFANWPYDTYLQIRCATGLTGDIWNETAIPRNSSHVRVWKNGAELTYGSDFVFEETGDPTVGRVKLLTESAKTNDIFRVWIQAGDAPGEELTVTYL